jgi:hypothetical protein
MAKNDFSTLADRGDQMHGDLEITTPASDAEVTRAADKQRYEAQKDEAEEYPGDSGAQAQARLKDDNYHGLGKLADQVEADALRGTRSARNTDTPEARGEGSPLTSKVAEVPSDSPSSSSSSSSSSGKGSGSGSSSTKQ